MEEEARGLLGLQACRITFAKLDEADVDDVEDGCVCEWRVGRGGGREEGEGDGQGEGRVGWGKGMVRREA